MIFRVLSIADEEDYEIEELLHILLSGNLSGSIEVWAMNRIMFLSSPRGKMLRKIRDEWNAVDSSQD